MTDAVAMNLPGHPMISRALQQTLEQALADKGQGYAPRTHHRRGNTPTYTNRLILSTSPYLLQHAHNPVNWFPWGAEAFDLAQAQNKPVFLSIGYSTCHWCHVMEGESFEDEEIAAFLNTHYVCIKVDREERPDVDAVYMSAVQNINGSGGWPMSVWLTPQRLPFFGGTYFPPRDGVRGAGRGFLSLARDLANVFNKSPEEIVKASQALVSAVKADMEGSAGDAQAEVPAADVVAKTVAMYEGAFDRANGGLRRAPKFPTHLPVRLLLRHHRRRGDANALHMATFTLAKMAAGGMYDQVGGGFHRYSTDAQWLVPHFEKMLYDNALLVVAYAEAFSVTQRRDFARVIRETLDYVLREMTSADGAFYSATDADSVGKDGRSEEGRFFVFTLEEIEEVLGDEAQAFAEHYGVTGQGNFEGANILHVKAPDEDAWARFGKARAKLYAARALRSPPARDDKILAAWNGLMISAFAVSGRILNEPRYVQAATRAADFIAANLSRGRRILRSYKDGRAQEQGFLDDQAFVAAAMLDVFEATADPRWLDKAVEVAQAMEEDFADREGGGWFLVPSDGESLLARERPTYDGAEPSGTSVALMNALRLATFTDQDDWRVIAKRGLAALRDTIMQRPMRFTEGLLALDRYWDVPREIVIVWPTGGREAAEPLLQVLRESVLPAQAVVTAEEGAALAGVAARVPFAAHKVCVDGLPTAYVCARGRCERPTHDPDILRAQLRT